MICRQRHEALMLELDLIYGCAKKDCRIIEWHTLVSSCGGDVLITVPTIASVNMLIIQVRYVNEAAGRGYIYLIAGEGVRS